jgi:MoaA/NifB/PqqE/SkfB family radical SAM enzyme
MTLEEKIQELEKTYEILHVVDLDPWHDVPFYQKSIWLKTQLSRLYRPVFESNQRIVFTLLRGDIYKTEDTVAGSLLTDLQSQLNAVDISNFFVILITNDDKFVPVAHEWIQKNVSADPVPFTHVVCESSISQKTLGPKTQSVTEYNSVVPLKIELSELTDRQRYLLTESKTFCMYPWIHLHSYPTGAAYPCCFSEMKDTIGDFRKSTMKEIWNDAPLRTIRQDMLSDTPVEACTRCYEQEKAGFFNGRLSANKHHGHHIDRVDQTLPDGTLEKFEITYWDMRFSNLCNLSCRSCGHIFSSSWHKDQTQLAGPEWAKQNKPLIYAGRFATDIYEQLLEHIDYVELIYFAGGEPLMMEEHYLILEELERRGRFDVRLVYNTNFTHTKLKNRTVFDYWRKFDSVSVGASLDDMGPRAEYIRKGTNWEIVEQNRRSMMEICPKVDFYISPTLSIMNAMHITKFHRHMVEQGFIRPQDININILQNPAHYRIDIAPPEYKKQIRDDFEKHLEWLRPLDPLRRATVGFESAINFLMNTDNNGLVPKFWDKTNELDQIRNENILEVIPELKALQ